jgi:GT2 family glycosyltransferase
MSQFAATVVIATRDRRDELRRALEGVYWQDIPLEVIVLDDGSTDGTEELVRTFFPTVIYRRLHTHLGIPALRNLGSRLASTPVLVSLDDDCVLTSPRTIGQTLSDFDHERIAAVGIPFLDGDERIPRHHPLDADRPWVASTFVGAAHAIRRDVFAGLGGYRSDWFYSWEEADLSLRMLANGFVVRLGTADLIEHRPSRARSVRLMDSYGRRNSVLFTWNNVPTRYLPHHFARITAKGVALAISTRRPGNHLKGFLSGCGELVQRREERSPVAPSVYRLYRSLQRRRAVALEEIEPLLPALTSRWRQS